MLEFLKEYLRHPASIGAVAPSGKALAEKMMEPIRFEKAGCIVEYGPGTGAFTSLLLQRRYPETRLILIEQNDTFFQRMFQQCQGAENVTVLHDTAERADRELQALGIRNVDYVISGLPFASLPRTVSVRIFRATQRILGARGRFITFQYTLVKQKFFREYFDLEERLFALRNLPPAFVFVCRNRT